MKTLLPITFLINFVFTVVEFLLGLRIILKLLGANPLTPFVNWIYATTQPLLSPFTGIFPNPSSGGFVLEMSALFALLVYGFIAFLAVELTGWIESGTKRQVKE